MWGFPMMSEAMKDLDDVVNKMIPKKEKTDQDWIDEDDDGFLKMMKEIDDEPKSSVKSSDDIKCVEVPVVRCKVEVKSIIKYLKGHNAWVCGGFARYVTSPHVEPKKTGDIDIYCESEEVYNTLMKKLEDDGFTKKYTNPVAVCYHKDTMPRPDFASYEINLIKPIREGKIVTNGKIEDILANFDFSVTRVALKSKKMAVADEHYIEDETKLFLRVGNIHCPISSVLRIAKYYNKGYWTKITEVVKLFKDWDGRGKEYQSSILDLASVLMNDPVSNKEENELFKDPKKAAEKLYLMMRVD